MPSSQPARTSESFAFLLPSPRRGSTLEHHNPQPQLDRAGPRRTRRAVGATQRRGARPRDRRCWWGSRGWRHLRRGRSRRSRLRSSSRCRRVWRGGPRRCRSSSIRRCRRTWWRRRRGSTCPSLGEEPVSVAGGGGLHRHDRRREVRVRERAVGLRVAEREDGPVARVFPVAVAAGRAFDADDGLAVRVAAHRPVEVCVAEAEEAAVAGDEPVAAIVGGAFHRVDRLVEMHRSGRAVEMGRPEREDAAVASEEPVSGRGRQRTRLR